jgi:hypothetical protein
MTVRQHGTEYSFRAAVHGIYIEQDGGGPRNRRQGVADLFDPQPYFRNFSSTLFSWQMNSIRSSSAARRQYTRTVQGFV